MAKLLLHNLKNVNTVLSMLYDKDGNYRAGFSPDEFYNTILLDTLKYGEENYVHLKYAESLTIKKGYKTARFRRWAGMTPTLRPLLEGVPPAPDKHAYETLEIGNVWSFGRWSEYTDQVDNSIISDIISERSLQYGELANQIKELYARKIWLSAPNEFYANFKANFSELQFGDVVTLDDLRFMVQRMKRMQVKPIAGKFNYICSPEWIYELIDDPRVKAYMDIEQTTGKLWSTGEPFDLFELNFIPTMLDEFAYPDTEFPGVYESNGTEYMRYYATPDKGNTIYYYDLPATTTSGNTVTAFGKTVTNDAYLPDGTAVEQLISWKTPKDTGMLTASSTVKVSTYNATNKAYSELSDVSIGDGDDKVALAILQGYEWIQLPVVRGILFGDEAMVKLNVEGLSDAPKMIIKPLGSSGVADPLDQRQSVGFRVDGFGLAIKRPEAICITYGLCKNAALAALAYSTADTIYGDYTLMSNYGNANSELNATSSDANYINTTTGHNEQVMNVDAVNGTRIFVEYDKAVNYSEGTLIKYEDEFYVFLKGYAANANGIASLFGTDGALTADGKKTLKKINTVIVE